MSLEGLSLVLTLAFFVSLALASSYVPSTLPLIMKLLITNSLLTNSMNIAQLLIYHENRWEDIASVVVKKSPDYILVALSYIFNQSLNTGIFPNLFKRAKIISISKVRNLKTLKQYRPISLLSIFSKILETIVNKTFYSFLTSNNLLSPSQLGFRKLFFTSHAAAYLVKYYFKFP